MHRMSSLGNTVKTFTLLAALAGLLVFVGGLLGGRDWMVIALLFAVVMNGFVYWKSDSLALRANGARELNRGELPRFRSIVGTLAAQAGLPMPRLYVIDRPEPNAFATGRDPEHAAVAVTTGILDLMDDPSWPASSPTSCHTSRTATRSSGRSPRRSVARSASSPRWPSSR